MFLKPDYNLKNIYEIDFAELNQQAIKCLMFDLDSTVMVSKSSNFLPETVEWFNSFIKDTLKEGASKAVSWATQGANAPSGVKKAGESVLNALNRAKNILLNESPHTFPRMDIVIKFYRTDEVMGISELMNPNFIYKIYGAYPVEITLVDPMSGKGTSASDIQRPVKFAYNHIVCLPDASWEEKYFRSGQHFPYKGLSPAKLLSQAQNMTATVAGQANSLSRAFK